MASYNAARAYGLKNIGAIAPGYKADMVLFEDLKDFRVKRVFTRFGKPYEETEYRMPLLPPEVYGSVQIAPVTEGSLCLPVRERMPVIKMVPEQLITELVYRSVKSEHGAFVPADGLCKLAVVERHHATGSIGVGIVEGMNIKNGAIASTVAHDSHNLVVAGDNDRDMLMAIESLRECGGGYCVVSRGIVLARLPLPIAGLMTEAPVEDVLARQRALLDAAKSLGADERTDPLIALSFLALCGCSSLRRHAVRKSSVRDALIAHSRKGRAALPQERLPCDPLLTGLPPRCIRHWRRSALPPKGSFLKGAPPQAAEDCSYSRKRSLLCEAD